MRTPHNEPVSSDTFDTAQVRVSEPDAARPPKASRKAAPERRCILSGVTAPNERMLRLAISPDGLVLPDPLAKAPGRGAWIGVTRAELEQALTKGKLRGALMRAFKGGPKDKLLEIPADLPILIESALERILLDRLGIEMRGGSVILGSEKIAEKARTGRVALLLHASDASEDGSKKLDQAWRVGRETEGSGQRGFRLPLDRAALSVALGRDNVVHLALADDAAAARIFRAMGRLQNYRGADEAPQNDRGDAGMPAAHTELNA